MRHKTPPLDPREPAHRGSDLGDPNDQGDGDDLTALAAELEREDLRAARQGRRHVPRRFENKGSKKPNWLLDVLLLSTLALLVYGYVNDWF